MRLSKRQIERARSADLPRFMEENYPDRIMKSGKSWRDAKYRDLTIWQDIATENYRFKAHSTTTQEINKEIVGSDAIAYVRRFLDLTFIQAVEALAKYSQLNDY